MAKHDSGDDYSEAEAAQRRDEVLKRMLSTPPKPHAPGPQSRVRNQTKAGAGQKSGRSKPDPAAS